MNIVFFNTQYSGHNVEYLDHLIDYLRQHTDENNYIFIVHPDFKIFFPEIFKKAKSGSNIKVVGIQSTKLKRATNNYFHITNAIHIYKLMDDYARIKNADHVFLLEFNSYQPTIGLYRQKYFVSGVLFRPFYRKKLTTIVDYITYLRKLIITFLYSKNKNVKDVFILNDKKTVQKLNTLYNTEIFKTLPDPVPKLSPLINHSIRNSLNIDNKKIIFLHFGALSERKGTINIIEAFSILPDKLKQKVVLLIIGKPESDSFDLKINLKIRTTKNAGCTPNIIYDNKFVSSSMMKTFFEQCDVVLVPYANIESSSGIVGHAISSKKLLIGPDKGLLAEIIREYGRGVLIPDNNPQTIVNSILRAITEYKVDYNNDQYLQLHSPKAFSKALIHSFAHYKHELTSQA